MRAKKLISIALLTAIATTAQAQIVSSRSDQVIVTQQIKEKKPKKPRTIKWNLRLGYSFDSMTGSDDLSGASGFDASFGISKPFGSSSMFWGVEAGAMTYGACMDDHDPTRCLSISVNPRIGVKIPIGQKTSFNLYGGPYISYQFGREYEATLYDYDNSYYDSQRYWHSNYSYRFKRLDIRDGIDAGINVGTELFVSNNFFFDIHIKKGLASPGRVDYYDNKVVDDVYESTQNSKKISLFKIVLGIGFQF